MSTPTKSTCPNCKAGYTVPADAIGKTTKCKKCGETFAIKADQVPAPQPTLIPREEVPVPVQRVVVVPVPVPFPTGQPEEPRKVEIEHRQRGRFGNGFLTVMGVLCAALVFFGGLTFLVCGGGLALFGYGVNKVQVAAERAKKEQESKEAAQSDPISPTPSPSPDVVPVEPPKQASGVTLTVWDASVKQIGFSNRGESKERWSSEEHFRVKINIQNTSKTKMIDYRPWGVERFSLVSDRAELSDNFGNRYKMVTFGLSAVPFGAVETSKSIYPEAEITDVLVFQKPVKDCEYLTLELPLGNVGEKGSLKIRIDAKQWQSKPSTK